MVYASPIDVSNDSDNLILTALADPPQRSKPVRVYFNDVAIDSIAGPVPLIDLNTTYNSTPGGSVQSTTTKITLTGKILRTTYHEPELSPTGVGTENIVTAISGLTNLFNVSNGILSIKCGDRKIYDASGIKVNSFNANKSNDNWMFTSDYTVDLEFTQSVDPVFFIKSGSSSWSVEPMEEYIYTRHTAKTSSQAETDNPKMIPSTLRQSDDAPNPPAVTSTTIDISTIPQFKISRKISAEGIPSGTGDNYSAYQNAKAWVVNQIGTAFRNNNPNSTIPRFNLDGLTTIADFDKVFLYNHLRTTNFSHLEGTYEVNDTWLGMPTGIKYVEDYSIESSTDERNIRTVRVQGSVKGLMIDNLSIMSGSSGMVPDNTGIINLQYAMSKGETVSSTPLSVNSSITQTVQDQLNVSSNDQSFYDNKYQNAMSGWINDIKPYLYRRAGMVINSPDRTKPYINATVTGPPSPPNNPVYSNEALLNIIPISTTEGHDPRKGTITYSYEYNNRFRFLSGVLSENITMNDTGPIEVINQAFVLGRRLGPVLQSMGAFTNPTKSINIEIIVPPPTGAGGFFITNENCPLYTGGTIFDGIKQMVDGFAPFGERTTSIFGGVARSALAGQVYKTQDDQNWVPTEGRYTRNVSWVYQPCELSRNYLEH